MSRLYNTFEFVGNLFIPKSKEKFHEEKTSDSGWEGHKLNFAIQESKTNSVFLEMYGGFSKVKQNKVFSFSKGTENNPGSKLEIPWDDRLNTETVDLVADFKKIVVDFTTDSEFKEKVNNLRYQIRTLEYQDELSTDDKEKLSKLKVELKELATDRYEFVHNYDAIVFLSTTLDTYKDHKFRVTGSVDYQEHKGRFFRKFNPELIEIVESDTPSKLRATMDIFFDKDALDDSDFKEEKKIYINGYVLSYDSKAKKDQFFPQQVVINAQKVDLGNESHVKRLEFLKNKFNVKGKGVYHLQWEVNIFRGADTIEFTFENLTPPQKEAVEFGYNKLEDFAPKGGLLGETTEENRLVKPILQEINKHNDFREGAVESSYTVEDLTFVAATVNNQPSNEKKEEPKKESKPVDLELDDLFA
jgi:hypothetical protein